MGIFDEVLCHKVVLYKSLILLNTAYRVKEISKNNSRSISVPSKAVSSSHRSRKV